MELNYNIKQIRKLKEYSQKEFAEILGVKNTVLSNWEQGIAKPDIEMITKISKLFGVTIEDLVWNKISEINESDTIILKEIPVVKHHQNTNEGIPVIPVEAIAGYGNGDTQVMDYEIVDNYKIPEFIAKGVKYLIRVSGSSMYPKYSNGDLLACKPIIDQSYLEWGKVYVLDTLNGPIVKRLFPCKDKEDFIECRSDNHSNYPPFLIPKNSIRKLSIVTGVIRME